MVTPELDRLREQYRELGVTRMLVKELAPNDNSKNQIYLGGSLQAANVLPTEEPVPSQSTPPRFFAKLRMSWLDESGRPEPAPGAQLILYPQYPEVRLSGFLKGCKAAPKFLGERGEGRLLILGTARGGTVIAVAFQRHDLIAIEYRSLGLSPTVGVFAELPVAPLVSVAAGRGQLLLHWPEFTARAGSTGSGLQGEWSDRTTLRTEVVLLSKRNWESSRTRSQNPTSWGGKSRRIQSTRLAGPAPVSSP